MGKEKVVGNSVTAERIHNTHKVLVLVGIWRQYKCLILQIIIRNFHKPIY